MSENSVDTILKHGIVIDNMPPKQIFDPVYYGEGMQNGNKIKSTLLIKDDNPHMKITIEDDTDDIYLKFEPLTDLDIKYDMPSIQQNAHITYLNDQVNSYTSSNLTSINSNFVSNKAMFRSKNPFVCPICNYEAAGGCSFQLHIMIHGQRKFYTCTNDNCDYSASNINELVRHIFKIHTSTTYYSFSEYKAEILKKRTNGTVPLQVKCKNETKTTRNQIVKKLFECDNCGYTTTTDGYFQRHLKTHVKANSKIKT